MTDTPKTCLLDPSDQSKKIAFKKSDIHCPHWKWKTLNL